VQESSSERDAPPYSQTPKTHPSSFVHPPHTATAAVHVHDALLARPTPRLSRLNSCFGASLPAWSPPPSLPPRFSLVLKHSIWPSSFGRSFTPSWQPSSRPGTSCPPPPRPMTWYRITLWPGTFCVLFVWFLPPPFLPPSLPPAHAPRTLPSYLCLDRMALLSFHNSQTSFSFTHLFLPLLPQTLHHSTG